MSVAIKKFSCLLAALLLAGIAHADTIVDVSATADFQGVETIATAFQFDTTTGATSGMSFASAGPLGAFSFIGYDNSFA